MKTALVIGGSRFFGRTLVELLLARGVRVSLLNRGSTATLPLRNLEILTAERKDEVKMMALTADRAWDIVYDQVCYDAPTATLSCRIFEGKVGQ